MPQRSLAMGGRIHQRSDRHSGTACLLKQNPVRHSRRIARSEHSRVRDAAQFARDGTIARTDPQDGPRQSADETEFTRPEASARRGDLSDGAHLRAQKGSGQVGFIEQRDAEMRLLFQGGGPSWPAARERAIQLGLKRCDWRPYVDEGELPASLLRAQVCAVTQIPATRGCLWPSKLGLVLTLPRPILWVGATDGVIARELRGIAHAVAFTSAPIATRGLRAF